uniref:Small ribosomal subunit protein uS4m n=1 Tax=Dictyostelium citrinum TaxID=361072 RepID=RT04_DICCI|nr:ribosomal protein S4 [Dictyostelium citrinum]P0C5Y3.1 RecName: Full=Small ribosomal subunit protein uS4m; AltName: Full=Ribosomal protein S4, mitochondrial [Dictyostelium citrinum]ACD12712.1 ribosomal protein S4 [Dictyostelium citrinum]
MRIRKNITKFIKRAYIDMGELKQVKGYTKTRLNIISNKVFLLKQELYPLKKQKKVGKLKKKRVTTYTRKKLKRILSLLFRIGGKIYRRKIKKKKINLKKKEEHFTNNLILYRLFRKFYINLKLKQFKRLYKKYKGNEKIIIQQLEKRIDMILLRSGFVRSIYEARQLINHKHILVNGNIARIPSYTLNVGDIISIKEGSHKQNLIHRLKKILLPKVVPEHKKNLIHRFVSKGMDKYKYNYKQKYQPNDKAKYQQNYKYQAKRRRESKKKRRIRATGPKYLEISHALLLISLIEEPKLTAIKYPFTLQPENNIKFISLLNKYKRIR